MPKINCLDVCWVEIPFTDRSGSKVRPALITQIGDGLVKLRPIYSRPNRCRLPFPATKSNGLRHNSFIDRSLVTVSACRIKSVIGHVAVAR